MQFPAVRQVESYLARQGTGEYKHITKEEASQLAAAAPREETRLKIKLLWQVGSRVTEIINLLRVEDLNFDRSIIKIHRLKRRREFLQDVPVSRELMNELRLFIRAMGRRGRVFTGDRTSTYRMIQKLGRKVLRRNISPKHFRHGRAYDLVRNKNVHPAIASRALGHATLSSILSYIHPTEEDLRNALAD